MAGSDLYASKTRSTAIWLGLFFVLALTLRIAFSVGTGHDDASGREIFTGNDPYYHDRSLRHLLDTGKNLNFDPAINYPEGRSNPNPPLFIWTTAPLAVGLEAAHVDDPTGMALNIMTGLWGALAIFPVYMIARDLWGRGTGLWAALFTAISAPHIQRSVWGYADHDGITMFLITLAFAFLVKAFRALNVREYVATWAKAEARNAGIKAAFTSNKTAFLWSALSGVALTATALVWKGYPYALAVIAVAVGFQLIADHLRNRDSTALFAVYLLPLLMVVVLPYLLYYRMFPEFLGGTIYPSLYVFLGVLVAGLILVPTREIPSIVVFPALLVAALVGLALLLFVFPAAGYQIFSGLGYFNQSKLYTTIAEAQRAQIGFVAASFGFFAFLFGFFGFWQSLKGAWKGDPAYMLVTAWGAVAFFMAFAASRFVMNAVPVFAIFIGVFMAWLFARLGFSLDKNVAAYGQRTKRSWGKWTLAVLAVVFIVVPNVWFGVDASMSSEYERDNKLDDHFFGAFGISFDLRDNGWLETMDYLSQQDTQLKLEDRPAVIAWWDYGHWNVGIGEHPTVADPFQSHYELAGRFLASESEEEGMSWLSILLVDYDYWHDGTGFSQGVASALDQASPGLSGSYPATGSYDQQYDHLSSKVNGTAVFPLYDHLTEATGKRVGYMAADIRMFPFGARSSGIFYAPVFLANKNPDDFLMTQIGSGSTTLSVHQYGVDDQGNSYRLKDPEYVDATGVKWVAQNGYAYRPGQTPLDGFDASSGIPLFQGNEQLIPTEKFANSMYTRAYGSYDANQPAGQGLSHWRVVQQSVGDYFGIPNARQSVLLEYYTGVTVSGTVKDAAGQPMAGYGVTFIDGTGARHGIANTDANGTYTVVAPFSDDGDLRLAVLAQGTEIYNRTDVQVSRGETAPRTGVDLTVPFASVAGLAYENRDGVAGFNATTDKALEGVQVRVAGRTATTGADGHYSVGSVPAGTMTVTGGLAGYNNATQTTVAKAGQAATADLVLSVRSSTVTLRFLDGADPVAQVPMSLTGVAARTVTTNAQGNATAVLAPGAYHVKVDYNVTKDGAT
ncbi:MAG: dolichyl-phosphooligosaccharide-protein glycotransferase, partial [Thermoplasmata archaeon]|nr:dolichyl-phosphooligosaccharide-protein glycotransferase [Thermoplasmata archaeon]